MLALHLLQISLVYVNTLMIQRVLSEPSWSGKLTPEDRRALTPLIYGHVNPYVRFEASFRPVMRYAKEVSDITRCSAIGLLPRRASPATARSEAWATT